LYARWLYLVANFSENSVKDKKQKRKGRDVVGSALLLALIHPSVPWPGTGHPEAMKMSCS
jgi:hypothetical protein